MALRHMSNSFKGFTFYESSFDPETGVLVRSVEVPEFDENYHNNWAGSRPKITESVANHLGIEITGPYYDDQETEYSKLRNAWAKKFGRARRYRYKDSDGKSHSSVSTYVKEWRDERAFSPVPETIDVKITDWCNFGCSYCLVPETRVLCEDGRWIPIKDVQEGEMLLGFEEHRSAKHKPRRLQRAEVLHKWETIQPEILIELSSGEPIRTSPNHLWLTDRSGWLPTSRLRPGMYLRQIPTWASVDVSTTPEFMRGYLAGLSWGDGTFQFDKAVGQVYWRVALKDGDILERANLYLAALNIECPGIRPFDSGTELAAPMSKVEVRNESGLARLQQILEESESDSLPSNFLRGFVSGFFDAEGSLHESNLRISQKNHRWALEKVARAMSPEFSLEKEYEREDGLCTYRLTNSTYWDILRFFSWCQPACRRKYPNLHDTQFLSERVKVEAVRDTGRTIRMVDITTSSHTFFAEGIATHNCYMDSTTKGKHAPRELLTTIFAGLDQAPYQIAFGGGEPTAHPDFPWFLQYTKEQGTVPNYTTAGHIQRQDVFDATNRYCGGVALTYHAFKGPEYFKKTYDTWRSKLDSRVQLNVHVLFDKDVADNLLDLAEVGLRNLNVVLLAYYPNVGRSSWETVPPRGVYEVTLPQALTKVQANGFRVAFSEGLLPYFLSHQLPEVDTRFAGQQEALFSCYVDDRGFVSQSSFDPSEATDTKMSIYKRKFQKIWNSLDVGYPPGFDACDRCQYQSQCHTPHEASFMLCKFAEHNKAMPKRIPDRKRRLAVLDD